MKTAVAVSSFLVACAAVALADQITLKNGDRVTGAIVKKDGKSITIKTDNFGVVVADWDKVDSIKSDQPLTVVTAGGETVRGPVAASGGTVRVEGPQPATVPAAQVAAIRNADEERAYQRLLRPGWGQLWAGTATVGFAGTSGNARTTTFTTGVAAARVTRGDKTSIYFNSIRASALVGGVSADTASAVRAGLSYNRNLGPRAFLNAFNDWEYDRFQNLDLRFVVGGGAGLHIVKNERSALDVLGGADYNHSKFATPFTRELGELYVGDEYSMKLSAATTLIQSFRLFNGLNDTALRRINFDLGASTKIGKWLNWNLSISDRYLNRPAPGRKTNDLLYTTGLGVTFAR